jgi:hypothetical protein
MSLSCLNFGHDCKCQKHVYATQTMLIMSMIISSTPKVGAKTLNCSGFLQIDRWKNKITFGVS